MSLKPDKPSSMVKDKLLKSEFAPKPEAYLDSKLTGLNALTYKPMPLLIGLLTAWIVTGAWIYRIVCCTSLGMLSPLLIQDGMTTVASAEESVRFVNNAATPIIPLEVEGELQKAAQYVATRPDKVLVVTGTQGKNEPTVNLNSSRADSLKAKFVGWGAPADYVITESTSSSLLRAIKDTIYGGANFAIKTIPSRFMEFSAEGFKTSVMNNLSFSRNEANIDEPIPDSIKNAGRKLVDYLKANPNMQLNIVGWSGTGEKYTGDKGDLGTARADALRDWWKGLGINPSQITIGADKPSDDLIFIGDKLYGGASYGLAPIPTEANNAGTDGPKANTTDGEENADDKTTDSKPTAGTAPPQAIVYFNYNSDVPNIDNTVKAALDKFVAYLKTNDNIKVNVEGYTDARGSEALNFDLSKRRANQVRKYLLDNGVGGSQISTKNHGAKNAVSRNESQMAKDRRVELFFQK